jgi:outer membrane protein OmpA-like peptidoglycan-associated protein
MTPRAAAIVSTAAAALLLEACSTAHTVGRAVGLSPNPCQDTTVTLYFEPNGDQVTPTGRQIIRYAADRLKRCPVQELSILGLSDANGNPVDNLELSKRRAEHVRDAFLAAGLKVERFTLRAAGAIGAQTSSGVQVPVRRRVDVTVVMAPPARS